MRHGGGGGGGGFNVSLVEERSCSRRRDVYSCASLLLLAPPPAPPSENILRPCQCSRAGGRLAAWWGELSTPRTTLGSRAAGRRKEDGKDRSRRIDIHDRFQLLA